MTSDPIVSIVIPCYNHGEYIEETLESIELSKDKYPVEVIIVNDGSTDANTLEVLTRVEKKGYFVLHQQNQGLAKARNNAISIAKGKYILPLDSDNKVCAPYLNEAVDILENTNVDIVYGDAEYIGEKTGIWKNKALDKKRLLIANQIDACAIFRKKVWKEVNGYAEDMPYMGCEDWNFWLKCIDKDFQFLYLDKICFEYRVLSNSMIRTVPVDFQIKILTYNVANLSELYASELYERKFKDENMFSGNILKKTIKLILNHFNLYKY